VNSHTHAPSAAHLGYRTDIDGLRAIAVLCVIGFHAFPALFPGGFVGVDVFFVISGYLITGILLRNLRERYARRRPESTLLYQIVERHYPRFLQALGASGRSLPRHAQLEFEDYLKCGRLEHGFLRVRCDACHAEKLLAFSCKRRDFCPSYGARRMAESQIAHQWIWKSANAPPGPLSS
jgi:hypothetical protein